MGVFGLGFKTLPVVFQYMPAGWFFGFVWFFMLFLAAITSSLSMLQPAIAFLEEGLGIGRRASVTFLGLITFFGCGFVIYFSKDLVALDTLDFWIGTALIFVLAMVEVVLYAWVFGVEKGYQEAKYGAEMKLPRVFNFVIKYVAPLYLLAVFVFWCIDNLPARAKAMLDPNNSVVLLSVGVIVALFIFFLLLIYVASRRWNGLALGTTRSPGRARPETAS
jgi:SNF family Na+-dependent transporter